MPPCHDGRVPARRLPPGAALVAAVLTVLAPVAPAAAAPDVTAPEVPAGGTAAVRDLTEGLRVAATTSYTVDLDASVVQVEYVATLTNQVADRATSRGVEYVFFPRYVAPVIAGVSEVTATTADGTPLPVRLEPGDDVTLQWADVDIPDLYDGGTQTVRLRYDLPTQPPRSGVLAQVNEAFATFPVFTGADPGLGDVSVSLPTGVGVDVAGSPMESTTSDGRVVLSATGIADPATWWSTVIARDDTALVQELVFFNDIGVKVQGWPGDPEWLEFTSYLAERGLPALRDAIGRPWSNDGQLTIAETSAPYVYGYGGWYTRSRSLIEIGDALDPQVTLHEMAHAWFNEDLFLGRWVNEGLADEFAAIAMAELGMERPVPDPAVPGAAGAVPLNDWAALDLSTPGSQEAESYGYRTSWWVANRLVEEIGVEAVAEVVDAAATGVPTYPATTDDSRRAGTADWTVFLDLLEGVGGSSEAEPLFRELVVGPAGQALLDERAAARAQYDELVAAGDGWAPPAALREAMTAWQFAEASAMAPEVASLLDRRDAVVDDLAGAGLERPTALQRQFEQADDVGDLAVLMDAAGDAAGAVVDVTVAREAAGPLVRVGALVTGVDTELAAAREALDRGDYRDAATAAQEAQEDLDGASGVGALAVGGAVVLVVVALLGLVLVRRQVTSRSRSAIGAGGPPTMEP